MSVDRSSNLSIQGKMIKVENEENKFKIVDGLTWILAIDDDGEWIESRRTVEGQYVEIEFISKLKFKWIILRNDPSIFYNISYIFGPQQ